MFRAPKLPTAEHALGRFDSGVARSMTGCGGGRCITRGCGLRRALFIEFPDIYLIFGVAASHQRGVEKGAARK